MIFIINWILASVCPCHCKCLSETSDTDSHLEHRIATTYHDDCIGWCFNDSGVVCDHKSVTSTTKSSAPVAIQKSMTSVKILLCSSYKFNVLLCATGRNSCLANCWCPHDGVSNRPAVAYLFYSTVKFCLVGKLIPSHRMVDFKMVDP